MKVGKKGLDWLTQNVVKDYNDKSNDVVMYIWFSSKSKGPNGIAHTGGACSYHNNRNTILIKGPTRDTVMDTAEVN